MKIKKSIVHSTKQVCTFNMYDFITFQLRASVSSQSTWNPYHFGHTWPGFCFSFWLISCHLPIFIHHTPATLALFLLLECTRPKIHFLFLDALPRFLHGWFLLTQDSGYISYPQRSLFWPPLLNNSPSTPPNHHS